MYRHVINLNEHRGAIGIAGINGLKHDARFTSIFHDLRIDVTDSSSTYCYYICRSR